MYLFHKSAEHIIFLEIRDKLENKVREIYHSIIKKIKIKYFQKTTQDIDNFVLYPEPNNDSIYFDIHTRIVYEKLSDSNYIQIGLLINNECAK